jgi:TetR/AcrR family transcriptional regulator, lmrAB and yxaGH operons repressor
MVGEEEAAAMATDTRARMLETTARLVQLRGYHGTSLNDVLAGSGAPRGSLYHHFPGGKDQLVLEATRAAVAEVTEALRETLAGASTPGAGVRAFVELGARVMEETDYAFGCPVAGIVLDSTPGADALATVCREAFDEWVGLLRASFQAAGLPPDRALALALMVESSIEGLLLIVRAYRDVAPARAVAVELSAAVDAALTRRDA